MQIGTDAQNRVDTIPPQFDKCNLADSWELAARILLMKKYGTWDTPGASLVYTTDTNSPDLQTTGQYNGSNGCQPNEATQCRWGVNYSYCDAVVDFIAGRVLPAATPEERAFWCPRIR